MSSKGHEKVRAMLLKPEKNLKFKIQNIRQNQNRQIGSVKCLVFRLFNGFLYLILNVNYSRKLE